ncbi:MAG: double zinc ribbon domain-containing protein [Dehalococcoidales bacterium]|nr:double zinc ribbon domain-containing protein [Dehalococcoidales bacterium]MDP6576694.1 double zinc ribbon domain-containing protein [Dehalococcoidales bacterium]
MDVLPQLAKLKGTALDLLFPQDCAGCSKEDSFLCLSYRQPLPPVTSPLCPRCGQPRPSGLLYPDCVNWQTEIDGIRSPFRLDGVIRQVSHQLKCRHMKALMTTLAGLLWDYFTANPIPAETLVSMPLHRKQLRERGYNQPDILTQEPGRLTSLPVIDDVAISGATFNAYAAAAFSAVATSV